LLHRDLKPANIMLTRSESFESVKLVDFGIAKALEANTRMTQDLTKTGDVLGTPLYMSPEQCLGFQLDCRSDIYSFGCLMVETLTGRPPFSGDNPMQIIAHHLNEAPIDAGERMNEMGIPTAFQDIAFTCLAKDPQDRYVEVDSLLADLIAVAEGRRPSVSGSRVSTNLRSPFVGLAIELLPFAVPVLGFTLVSVARPSGENRLIDHCAWSAFVSFLLFVFYLIKALHLKASSKLTNKRAAYFVRKFHSFLVTAIAAMVFCLSQVAVYVDFLAYEAAQTVEKVKYVPSWYFVVLWVALASIPFLVAASRRRREN
ncbi:MAG: serine/threonine protein kinase, partial [Candidatus Obscuribacterales bacterium]|nr:serine/threonine protein kinase [Candidatus Obscuribacterales bacterium]